MPKKHEVLDFLNQDPLKLAEAGLRLQSRRLRRLVKRSSKKPPGTPPGTIVYTGSEKPSAPVTVRVHVFDEDTLKDVETKDIEQIHQLRSEGRVWIDVEGVHDAAFLRQLGDEFGLHILTMEDIARTGQRPKVETYDGYAYIVVRMLRYLEEDDRVDVEQVSIILAENYVLSFGERPGDVFDPVRQRLMNPQSHMRTDGVDYLVYRLLDVIVDNYFIVMEKLGDRLEQVDAHIMDVEARGGLNAIHALKQESLLLRRSVWPLREVLAQLERGENPYVRQTTRVYLRDVYDHTVEVIETIESVRDLISGMLDLHLTLVSNRMNEVMKVLTIITTLFVPLTFIVGIYGMNFDFMPELNEPWAYPAVWAVMIAITIGQLIFFRRKRWI